MNAFAPKHLGVGAPPPDNSIILKKPTSLWAILPQGCRRTLGATRFSGHVLGRVRLLRLAPASFLALGRESQQAIFKPAIWDEPIKGQKRKKARKLYACGPSGNINPMF